MFNYYWPKNNLFNKNDKKLLVDTVSMDPIDADLLVSSGQTKRNADRRGGMWYSNRDGEQTNFFKNIHAKLSCCLGSTDIEIPRIEIDPRTKQWKKVFDYLKLEKDQCNFDSANWYDDGSLQGHNDNCEKLFERYVGFLEKFDPQSDSIRKYGGCFSNRFTKDLTENLQPQHAQIVKSNRTCTIPECQQRYAYKRKSDRYPCETTICNAEISYEDLNAEEMEIMGASIVQNCDDETSVIKDFDENEKHAAQMKAKQNAKQTLNQEMEHSQKEINNKQIQKDNIISDATEDRGATTYIHQSWLDTLINWFSGLFTTSDYDDMENFRVVQKNTANIIHDHDTHTQNINICLNFILYVICFIILICAIYSVVSTDII